MQTKQELVKVEDNQVKATFRVPLDVMKELKHKAVDENIPLNTLIVKALKDFLDGGKKK